MIIACHQPAFLPWSGFFYKTMRADCLVLLDEVQFARGFTWVNRNRLKNEQGELWLSVPVCKKGRGLQTIKEVEICYERNWLRKHLQSLRQHYRHAPYYEDHQIQLEDLFHQRWKRLVDLNVGLIRYLAKSLGIANTAFLLQSELKVRGHGSDLLINVCERIGAQEYLAPAASMKYLDADLFRKHGVSIMSYSFFPPIYPQLYGKFISDLSFLDLLLTCGGKSRDIILRYNR